MYAIVQHALVLMLQLSVIPLAVIAVGCGLVSLLQAAMQVQEQSILHLARIGLFALLVVVGGQLAFSEVQSLFVMILSSVEHVGDTRL